MSLFGGAKVTACRRLARSARSPQLLGAGLAAMVCRSVFSTMTAEIPSAWGHAAKTPQVHHSLQRLSDAVARRPILIAVLSCALKAYAADSIIQMIMEKKEKLDQRRSFLFLSFGGLFQGGFQYFIWNVVFESLWPGRSRYASMCKLAASWQIWQRKDILLVLSILSATSLNH
ncbi:Uncharacterized protein SCF082_LOCUS45662 [Durusdinium trenchii]|uniref:Peroxisomal membrane protein PMP22 n=1 Tax=Durusdinium trenchii TaxID=1381693 RepID=A0ABP0RAK8_9DINO